MMAEVNSSLVCSAGRHYFLSTHTYRSGCLLIRLQPSSPRLLTYLLTYVLIYSKFSLCFRPGTDPASLLIWFFLLSMFHRFKSDRDEICRDSSSSKYAMIMHRLTVSVCRIFDLTSHFQDGGHDVISRRKVIPPSECTRSVCPAHMQQRSPVPDP